MAPTAGSASEVLRIEGIHKAFGNFVALQSIDLSIERRRDGLLRGAVGLRQDDAPAHHRRPRGADARTRDSEGPRRLHGAALGARLRHRVPVVCAVPEPHDRAERRLRSRQSAKGPCRDHGAREGAIGARRLARFRGRSIPGSSPAASSSASRWRVRSPRRRRCCCSTSRCLRSMPRCASVCAAKSARCSGGCGSLRSWSRTTRRKRCRCPTASS